jgi:uncharacterized protein with GYD domain
MALYLTQFAYTPEAWAALTKKPEDRGAVVRPLIEKLGGRLISLYYCFGEYDGFLIYEAPNEITASAVVLAAVSPGDIKAAKTTVLLTVEQAIEAMRKAGAQTYRGPQK